MTCSTANEVSVNWSEVRISKYASTKRSLEYNYITVFNALAGVAAILSSFI